jgi:hypothetical protein
MTTSRIRTVKVCTRCIDDARDAGYYVTQRESPSHALGPLPAPRITI